MKYIKDGILSLVIITGIVYAIIKILKEEGGRRTWK
jgi:hypothetical protein